MQYDLVFEGGGAKGMVFVGALQEFEAGGHAFGRLIGTSAGAITASLLAAGYDSARMLAALEEQENGQPVFAGFLGEPGPFDADAVKRSVAVEMLDRIDIPLVPDRWEEAASVGIVNGLLKISRFRHMFSFVEQGGWFTASRFVDWMTKKLDQGPAGAHTGYGGMTLQQFHTATNRELTLIASDTAAQRMLVLNHRTAPGCPLVWAVRMSMSIPLVWPEVEWRESWGPYRGGDVTGHTVVDGGVLSNFPIALFVSKEPPATTVMGGDGSDHVLGFLIDEKVAVKNAPPADAGPGGGFQLGSSRTGKRVMALVDTMTGAHDADAIEAFADVIVRMPALGYGTMEFGMSPERRDALVAAGRDATREYFRKAAEPKRRPKGPPPTDEERRDDFARRVANRILS